MKLTTEQLIRLLKLWNSMKLYSETTRKLYELSHLKGLAWLLALPGVTHSLLTPVIGGMYDPEVGLAQQGWTTPEWSEVCGDWVYDKILAPSDLERITVETPYEATVFLFPSLPIAAVKRSKSKTILLPPDSSTTVAWLRDRIKDMSPGPANLVRIQLGTKAKWGDKAEYRFSISPLTAPTLFEGPWAPAPKELQKSHEKGLPVLLLGPSGSGKTATALNACVLRQNKTVLFLAGTVFADTITANHVNSIIELFGADALIIDDMPQEATLPLLAALDELDKTIDVTLTLMTSDGVKLPGFRPERVGCFLEFSPLSAEDMKKMLAQFEPNIDWTGIELPELTPAYLKELSKRTAENKGNWEEPLKAILRQHEIAN